MRGSSVGQLTLWSEEAPASHSASPGGAMDWTGPRGSCGSGYAAFVSSCLDGSSGRTSRGRFRAATGRISDACSGAWMTSGTVWSGEFWTRSSSEWPSDAGVCFLSDVLEPNPPSRFCLSPTACAGIIRRAERRGKPLPPELDEALRSQASSTPQGQGQGA